MSDQRKITPYLVEWNRLNRKVRGQERELQLLRDEVLIIQEHLDILGKTLLVPMGKRLGS